MQNKSIRLTDRFVLNQIKNYFAEQFFRTNNYMWFINKYMTRSIRKCVKILKSLCSLSNKNVCLYFEVSKINSSYVQCTYYMYSYINRYVCADNTAVRAGITNVLVKFLILFQRKYLYEFITSFSTKCLSQTFVWF